MFSRKAILSIVFATSISCLFTFSEAQTQVAPYETWVAGAGGVFNVQGYQDSQYRQFYPFGHKIADLFAVDLSTSVLLLSPTPSGAIFAYWVFRKDGAPVFWIFFDANFNVINSAQLFANCSYSVS